MRLTQHTDYALRMMMYLALHPGRPVPVREMAGAFGLSEHHLDKVSQTLTAAGLVDAVRGRNGGIRLSGEPEDVNVGSVVRATEPDFRIVECFDPATNACRITPACGLRGALDRALRAFLNELDGVTLADLVTERVELLQLLA